MFRISARVSNYHYYTQPVDPEALAAAARRVRTSMDDKPLQKSPRHSHVGSNMMPETRMSSSSSMGSTISTSRPWRRLSNIKNSLLGTPRFHRRKLSSGSSGTGESDSEENQMLESSDLVKKSWFGSLASSVSVERNDVQIIPAHGKTVNAIKAELIRAFLTIHELSHSVVGQNSFRVEYKRGPTAGGSVFSRGVKMQVDIVQTAHRTTSEETPMYVVQFALLAGPIRRFKRLVDHLTAILQASQQRSDRSIALMVRPRRLSDSSVSSACSDSDSNTTTTIPHVRSQTAERVETNSTINAYTLRSATDVRHAQPSSNDLSYQRSRRNVLAAYLKSPVPRRRNPSLLLDGSGSHLIIGSGSDSGKSRKGSPSAGVVSVGGDSNEHDMSTRSMLACSTSTDERSSASSRNIETRSQPGTPKQPLTPSCRQRTSQIPILKSDNL
uniref:Serine/threonine-protein kinase BRSK2 n=1 Tax=Setaria digitata TaxID=48799 RepID=A0A915PVU2_9BILA